MTHSESVVASVAGEEDEIARVLGQAFADNPLHVAVFGRREIKANEAFFRVALSTMTGERRLAIDETGAVLGFVHWNAWPNCQLKWWKKLRTAAAMGRGLGVRRTKNIAMWQSAWSKRDPKGPHIHLGPIGVLPQARGRGIGRRLMDVFCEDLDRHAAFGYLETDRAENLRFYAAFGFEVIDHAEVLDVTNYFMRRPASLP